MGDTEKKTKSARKVDGKTSVYMNPADKERFVRIAEEHGLNLSAFFRLAANEYIREHNWEQKGVNGYAET